MKLAKLPPSSIEAEEALIGCVFIDNSILDRASGIVSSGEEFYRTKNGIIWDVMLDMRMKGTEIDWITIKEELEKRDQLEEVGGTNYLREATEFSIMAQGYTHYAQVIHDKFILRSMIKTAHEVIQAIDEPGADVTDLAALFEREAEKVTRSENTVESAKVTCDRVVKEFSEVYEKGELPGWKTGNWKIDWNTLGYQPGAVSVIAGRTGEGKSFVAWGKCMAFQEANPGKRAGIVSGEMSGTELVSRQVIGDEVLGLAAGRKLEPFQYEMALERVNRYKDNPVTIADMPSMSLRDVLLSVRKLAVLHKCSLIVVDFAQMIYDKAADANEMMINICRELKSLARRLGIQILVLSQITKAAAKEYQGSLGIDAVYGGSALSWVCHSVSIIFRPEMMPESKSKPVIAACEAAGIDQSRVTFERFVKGRRGSSEFTCGHIIGSSGYTAISSGQLDQVRKVL